MFSARKIRKIALEAERKKKEAYRKMLEKDIYESAKAGYGNISRTYYSPNDNLVLSEIKEVLKYFEKKGFIIKEYDKVREPYFEIRWVGVEND